MNFFLRNACFSQIGIGDFRRSEKMIRDRVGDHSVDLFGHAAVVAAQAGLHMDHRDVTLARNEGAGERGVDVAHHEHAAGLVFVQRRLEALHDLGGLYRVRAGADGEVDVGFGQFEVGSGRWLIEGLGVAPDIEVTYGSASKRLLRFKGLSNIRDDKGRATLRAPSLLASNATFCPTATPWQ